MRPLWWLSRILTQDSVQENTIPSLLLIISDNFAAIHLPDTQDGRSSALTAPNGPAQSEVLKAALQDARMGPEALAGLGMHGTATPLGDPIGEGSRLTSRLHAGQQFIRASFTTSRPV